ncbi:sulfatase-like hydrolase/transferase [Mycobacterium sp. ML4]
MITYDAKDPNSAPNVLLILLDDVGFGAASAFGGPCQTPVAQRLSTGGLRYNRFHTTALCSSRLRMRSASRLRANSLNALKTITFSAPLLADITRILRRATDHSRS